MEMLKEPHITETAKGINEGLAILREKYGKHIIG